MINDICSKDLTGICISPWEAFLIIKEDGTISYLNPAAEKMLGYKKEEAFGKHLQMFLSPADIHEAQKIELGLLEAQSTLPYAKSGINDEGRTIEVTISKKDNEELFVSLKFICVASEDHKNIVCIIHDKTEQKIAQYALKQSEEEYRTLFEEFRDVIFVTTPEGRFIQINKAGVKLFGYQSKEELLKEDINNLYVNNEDRETYKKAVEKYGYVDAFEVKLKDKKGNEIIASITANVAYDRAGNIKFYRGIIRDITNIKRLKQKVNELQRLEDIGRLSGEIAHEFNNILSIILGNTQMIKLTLERFKESFGNLTQIEQAVFRAVFLADQLLTFGGYQPLNLQRADINQNINSLLKTLPDIIPEGIEINTVLEKDIPEVKIDFLQFNQALHHIIQNACEAIPKKGNITISTKKEDMDELFCKLHSLAWPGEYVTISIDDSGIGIDPAIIEKIFEPFFTTKKEDKHKGLGLSVAYGIIKNHNGFIDVRSSFNLGTTVKIYIPAFREKARQKKIAEIEDRKTKKTIKGTETILFAEDEHSIREMCAFYLNSLGYNVLSASNGIEAVEIFKQRFHEIDLVILDLAMPKMGGRDAYYEMKRIEPTIKAIFISGYSLGGSQTDFISKEDLVLIQKPYSFDTLAFKIREILSK